MCGAFGLSIDPDISNMKVLTLYKFIELSIKIYCKKGSLSFTSLPKGFMAHKRLRTFGLDEDTDPERLL